MKKFEVMSGKEWAAPAFKAGRARGYITPFDIQPGHIYLLALRVSNRERKANLDDQEANLRHQIDSRGGKVVVVADSKFVGSGFDPYWVAGIAMIAKRMGATILAESTDRFVRNVHFHSHDFPDVRATDEELQELAHCAFGVPLMAWLDPDMPLREVRSYQTKRGQAAKGKRGGRPRSQTPGYKLRRRELWQPRVLRLRERDKTLGEIVKETGLPKTVVWEWLQKM